MDDRIGVFGDADGERIGVEESAGCSAKAGGGGFSFSVFGLEGCVAGFGEADAGLGESWAEDFDIDAGRIEDAVPVGVVGEAGSRGDHGFEANGIGRCEDLIGTMVNLPGEEFA